MTKTSTNFSPLVLLALWILIMTVLTPIFMFGPSAMASGGQQLTLTVFMKMVVVMAYGLAAISALIPIIFRQWFKNNRWFLVITVLTIVPTTSLILNDLTKEHYSFEETVMQVASDTFMTKTEYYQLDNPKRIRSISIWKNGKKDSAWVTFTSKGDTIRAQQYRNDKLIRN